ncbi:MAG TPA: two-component regulator propeller domain-containing protein, partial [Spirochaetota bacterium]|nr:two-component regulator propeller domain-containing protein [Spirochaetota bacterium]
MKLLIFLTMVFFSTFLLSGQKLDKDKKIHHYIKTDWTMDDGLVSNNITDINQDKNGYIWIGTYDGLMKFDGVKFTTYNKYSKNNFNSNSAKVILKDKENNLWIGTNGDGVICLKDNKSISYNTSNGLINNTIRALYQDKDGKIWVGTVSGISIIDTNTEKIESLYDFNVNFKLINCISCDNQNNVLFATSDNGLYLFKDNKLSLFDKIPQLNNYSIRFIRTFDNKLFYFGTANKVLISADMTNNSVTEIIDEKKGFMCKEVSEILYDNEIFWISTDNGLYRMINNKIERYSEDDGLPNNLVEKIFIDYEGNLWAGTSRGGLVKFSNSKFTTLTDKDGLIHNVVNTVFEDKNQNIWIGTDSGLTCYKNGTFIENKLTGFLNKYRIRHIFEDSKG